MIPCPEGTKIDARSNLMNRGYLALGAALVLAAVIGLYVVLHGEDGAGAPHDPAGPKIAEAARGDHGKPGVTVTPIAPREDSRPAASDGPGARVSEYTIGGVRVRDHRSGDHAPLDIPPAIHPPEGRKIPSQLTSDISQRLRTVLAECAAGVLPEARGAASRVEGEIQIAITDHHATITSATYQARDVDGEAQASIKRCMEQKSVGVATPSGDEPDVEGYAIALSLRLP